MSQLFGEEQELGRRFNRVSRLLRQERAWPSWGQGEGRKGNVRAGVEGMGRAERLWSSQMPGQKFLNRKQEPLKAHEFWMNSFRKFIRVCGGYKWGRGEGTGSKLEGPD